MFGYGWRRAAGAGAGFSRLDNEEPPEDSSSASSKAAEMLRFDMGGEWEENTDPSLQWKRGSN